MKRFTTALKATTMAFAAASLMATSAMATDGMFGNGTGARNKALAGSGVADQNDATAMSINPAGLVHSENMVTFSASLFSPQREYQIGAAPISESESEYFVIPNIAYSNRIDASTVFGLSMYGNGGMNTDYPFNFTPPGTNGNLGVDLTQIFLSAGLAKSYGSLSVGVAPIVAIQLFSADGLPGMSDDTNVAFGAGLRAGVEWAATDNFRLAVAGATPMWSQAFGDYKNTLLATSDGEIRVPATITAGIALDVTPTFTVMADYKRIFHSTSKAISTKFNAFVPPMGAGGFGWKDINVYKIGVEWDVNPGFTVRAGYSYNDSPLRTDGHHFFPNIMTPAVSQHHITGGAKFAVTDTIDMELSGMYSPEESVSTPGLAPAPVPPTTVKMSQWELTAGVVWKLGN